MEIERTGGHGHLAAVDEDDDVSPVEQVRLTVPVTDDPTLPLWTFRMWTIGFVSCALLSFFNQFFAYRTEPIIISQITIQVSTTYHKAGVSYMHGLILAIQSNGFCPFESAGGGVADRALHGASAAGEEVEGVRA